MDSSSQQKLIRQWQDQIQATEGKLIPVGASTKPAMFGNVGDDVLQLATNELVGVVAYDPSEFLITAYAGTPIRELVSKLNEQGQFLPFDPLFVDEGATLGGTIASGLNGPHRMLFGGQRDFVMEVALIDGLGHHVRGGGKVVKNSAGFDLPKLIVGSYGRLGVMTELTLKVLPQPESAITLCCQCESWENVAKATESLLANPLPVSAVEISPEKKLEVCLLAPHNSLASLSDRAIEVLSPHTPGTVDQRESVTTSAYSFLTARRDDERLLRIACDGSNMESIAELAGRREVLRLHGFSAAGSIGWISIVNTTQSELALKELDDLLVEQRCSGVFVNGVVSAPTFVGNRSWVRLASRIQAAVDPNGKFVSYESGFHD